VKFKIGVLKFTTVTTGLEKYSGNTDKQQKYVSDPIIATSEDIASITIHPFQSVTAKIQSIESFQKDIYQRECIFTIILGELRQH